MPHCENRRNWTVVGEEQDLSQRVTDHCRSTGLKVDDGDDEGVIGTQGSQLGTRLLGGWFVPASWLPKKVTVTVTPIEGGRCRIRVHWEDTLGFGIMDPILRDKYEKFFERWTDELVDALAAT